MQTITTGGTVLQPQADPPLWWQRGVVYQIYPRSFQDTNADGIGDLPGITARLPYLQWLGVDAIWLSPFYPSPMADFGYDVSDHCAVDPMFGTLDDFDRLVTEAHALGLRVILDFVPNHTSDQHPWFRESRSSRDNPKRDWYIWHDPAPDGGPPNNWVSNFGGSAWTRDPGTGQFYYHAYLPEQPDLNWRNPEVQEAMLGVMRFWLERGVDGFRIDALRQLIKDDQLRDNPPNPEHRHGDDDPYHALIPLYTTDRPEIMEIIARMRGVADEYPQRVLIGELYLPIERLVAYYGTEGAGLHLPANFHLLSAPWNARVIAALIEQYEAALPPHGWPNWVLGNHDRGRIASRIGPVQARVAAMLLLTLRGTPTLYYGDEIGMRDVPIPPEREQDPWGKRVPGRSRDPARTPMPWDFTSQGGFTKGTAWLPLADDYLSANVSAEKDDPTSMLSLYRRLLALRRAEPALSAGSYIPLGADGDMLAYVREADGRRFVVALNLNGKPYTIALGDRNLRGRIVVSTDPDRDDEMVRGVLELRVGEGVIVELEAPTSEAAAGRPL